MASGEVTVAEISVFGCYVLAFFRSVGATGVEATTLGGICGRGNITAKCDP